MKRSLILNFILISLSRVLFAVPQLDSAAVSAPREVIATSAKAQAEINSIPKTQKQSSTDAKFSGILKLKDPRPEIITRDWKYFMGFKMQSLHPKGNVNNNVVGNFDLENNNATAHPSFEIGFSKPLPNDDFFANWGILMQTGFSTAPIKLTFPSGYSAPQDTHLNTLTSAIGAKLEVALPRFSSLYFNSSARVGRISYTQTSINDLAQFSEAASFYALGLGTSYNFYDNWQLTADYSNRKISQKSDLKIQSDNTELGLRVTW
jgi:opacity protein-like surface antigen